MIATPILLAIYFGALPTLAATIAISKYARESGRAVANGTLSALILDALIVGLAILLANVLPVALHAIFLGALLILLGLCAVRALVIRYWRHPLLRVRSAFPAVGEAEALPLAPHDRIALQAFSAILLGGITIVLLVAGLADEVPFWYAGLLLPAAVGVLFAAAIGAALNGASNHHTGLTSVVLSTMTLLIMGTRELGTAFVLPWFDVVLFIIGVSASYTIVSILSSRRGNDAIEL